MQGFQLTPRAPKQAKRSPLLFSKPQNVIASYTKSFHDNRNFVVTLVQFDRASNSALSLFASLVLKD